MKRTFLAIEINLNNNFSNSLKKLKSELKDEKIRWVDIKDYHLTLCFIGDTDEDVIGNIAKALNKNLQNYSKFPLTSGNLNVFKSIDKPHVSIIEIEQSDKLIKIREKIKKTLISFGYQSDYMEFKPHLTIARTKTIEDRNNLKKILLKYKEKFELFVDVKKIIFYESKLTQHGPIYKVISEIPLLN
nr:RNA 2',3'-cyclic phosphodiesterase [Bacteroidales bacterium]